MASVVPAMPRDPLRTYQFRVGVVDVSSGSGAIQYVAGARSVSGLRAQVSAYESWEGGNNLHRYANPNKVTWEPITLEQGLALDNTLELWSEAVLEFVMTGKPPTGSYPRSSDPGARPVKAAVKRQVVIDVFDENEFPQGSRSPPAPTALDPRPTTTTRSAIDRNRCRRYRVHNAWVSKYQAIPKLDSMTSEVGLVSVELVHEGWVREDFT